MKLIVSDATALIIFLMIIKIIVSKILTHTKTMQELQTTIQDLTLQKSTIEVIEDFTNSFNAQKTKNRYKTVFHRLESLRYFWGTMNKTDTIKIFEDKQVRTAWDANKEKWFISIADVVEVL